MEQRASLTPAQVLGRIDSHPTPSLAVVTGESGTGKTTWITTLLQTARQRGLLCAGLISPPVYRQGKKNGFDLLDIASGEKRRLGTMRALFDPQAATKKWALDEEVLAWGNQVLRQIERCDLLVIDELGPLELEHGAGYTEGLLAIERRCYRLGVIVIRPGLLPAAEARWKIDPVVWLKIPTKGEQGLE